MNRPVGKRVSRYNSTDADSIVKVEGGVGLNGIHGSYQGNSSTFWEIGGCIAILGIVAVIAYPRIKKKLNKDESDIRNNEEKQKSERRKEEASENSRHRMNEAKHQCELNIWQKTEESRIRVEEVHSLHNLQQASKARQEQTACKVLGLGEWEQRFSARFPMPPYSAIPLIGRVLDGCPDGFKSSMLLHLLSTFGALCFSSVRALYLDKQYHSASLQVVIEGEQGSGKSNFKNVCDVLFQRVLVEERKKAKEKGRIIQLLGVGCSKSRLMEIIACNENVYLYMLETEIDFALDAFKKNGGLSTVLLRKAFSNESVSFDNRHVHDEYRGLYPVYLNYTFTGTPDAVDRFFKEKENKDGTASRVCFGVIPEIGVSDPEFDFPEGAELERMRDRIDEWRDKYCFMTKDGIDSPADEYRIEVSYVFGPLKNWIAEQKGMGDKVRTGVSRRMAAIAFHGAMVLHMLAGEPGADDKKVRKSIRNLTIYLANHCMERFLYRYYKGECPEIEVPTERRDRRKLTEEEIAYWYPLWQTSDENGNPLGYGRIAQLIGDVSRDDVRNAFRRYEHQNGLG